MLFIITSEAVNAQRKKLDTTKYKECSAQTDIDLSKPKKYVGEINKYLDKKLILIYTDNQNHILQIERGYLKNIGSEKKEDLYFIFKADNDSTKVTYSKGPLNMKNQYCYFADCFDAK